MLSQVVETKLVKCEFQGDNPEDVLFDRFSSELCKILRNADDAPDTNERTLVDRGWENELDMRNECTAGWRSGGNGTIARGQSEAEATVLVAKLTDLGLEALYEADRHELCYKKRRQALAQNASLPVRGERVRICNQHDTTDSQCATVLNVDASTLLVTVVYENGTQACQLRIAVLSFSFQELWAALACSKSNSQETSDRTHFIIEQQGTYIKHR